MADVYLKRTLDEVTPGLWVKGMLAYYSAASEWIVRTKTQASFKMNISPAGDTSYQQFGTNSTMGNSNNMEYVRRSTYLEGSIGYNRVFNNTHGIDAVVLVNNDAQVTDGDLPYIIFGGSARVAYNYKQKYVLEATMGINGSNRYPPDGDYKYGSFPAIGAAWNLDREDFMKSVPWISTLKLFTSYGKTGWDNPGYFSYIQRYFDGPNVYFGTSAGGVLTMVEQPLANENITFEKAKKFNVGIQTALFNNRLGFSAEVYDNKFYDMLMVKGRNTTILGNTYPTENIGRYRYSGLDANLNWRDTRGKFSYYVNVNGGVINTVSQYTDEVFREYDWMRTSGRMIGQRFGFKSDGLFQTIDEIKTSATVQGYNPQPGDIKYKDLNGDGVINQFDMAPIGIQKPTVSLGFSLGANWNGFDFNALLQGLFNRDYYLDEYYYEFQGNGFNQAYSQHLGRWTPATAATATYPRLSLDNNINNEANSDYWVRNGNYMRLKSIELGYSLPASVIKRVRLTSARVFVNGLNLLTFSGLDNSLDPEAFYNAYPLQKMVNIGVNIKL
jgi:TonB-linked SusC/RagA family outer membrane protein